MSVYWVVWDAAAAWVVDRMVAEGRLPAVAAVRGAGVHAQARPPVPNCQTPPSLATLFTGTLPQRHGVTGFWVPGARDCHPLSQLPAFSPGVCREPMIWERLGELGFRSAFVHVPWVFGHDGEVPDYVDCAVEMFGRRRARSGVVDLPARGTLSWRVAGEQIEVHIGEDSSVRVRSLTLDPDGGWVSLALSGSSALVVRLLQGQHGLRLAHSGAWEQRCAGADGRLVAALRGETACIGEGLGAEYRNGKLGARLAENGTGEAEACLMTSLSCVARSFRRVTRRLLANHSADLVVVYLPMTDEIGHEVLGWCDAQSRAYRPDIAALMWQLGAQCYEEADEILGDVLARATPSDTVVLSADHGMAGVSSTFYPNAVLASAGLARPDYGPDGGADRHSSDVLFHLAGNGLLMANGADMAGGRVALADVPALMRHAADLLASVVDPVTGRYVVKAIVDVTGAPVDPGRETAVYLLIDSEYLPSPDIPEDGSVLGPPLRNAAHTINDGNPRLFATFAATGPGLGRGADLGVIENAQVSDLVMAQLTRSGPRYGRQTRGS
jgi:Type I phosphodiesterase / nucleotide pyrophosphatase